jgi:hypothetical protein
VNNDIDEYLEYCSRKRKNIKFTQEENNSPIKINEVFKKIQEDKENEELYREEMRNKRKIAMLDNILQNIENLENTIKKLEPYLKLPLNTNKY